MEANKVYNHLLENLRRAYIVLKHQRYSTYYSLADKKTLRITRRMLEESCDMSIQRLN